MEYMNVGEAARQWGVTERRVTTLCRNGRVEGAVKEGRVWFVPKNINKPEDARTSQVLLKHYNYGKLPLPIGISSYKEIANNYYYVDKTLLLKEFLDTRPKVTLFTRPRSFGKTLMLDMMKVFFEISNENTEKYFLDKNIWDCGIKYTDQQGKYPVIFISFKDIELSTWEESFFSMKRLIQSEYNRHYELIDSIKLTPYDKKFFQKVMENELDDGSWSTALGMLCYFLHKEYNREAIILIDEYDTPIWSGKRNNYSVQMNSFMRSLFASALKDNEHLAFACMTGTMGVERNEIFGSIANIKNNSVMEGRFQEYFGFTKEEITKMAVYYEMPDKIDEISNWYSGYQFGDKEVYNPWSTINYIDEGGVPKAFLQFVEENDIIKSWLLSDNQELRSVFISLIKGEVIGIDIDMKEVYPKISEDLSGVYNYLLSIGFLRMLSAKICYDGNIMCDVRIPNREIALIYEKALLESIGSKAVLLTARTLKQQIEQKNLLGIQSKFEEYIKELIKSTTQLDFTEVLRMALYSTVSAEYCIFIQKEIKNEEMEIHMEALNPKLPNLVLLVRKINQELFLGSIEKEEFKEEDKIYEFSDSIKENSVIKFCIIFCETEVRSYSMIEKKEKKKL